MTFSDGLMILAVLLAPIFAVQVQKWLEQFRAERERQLRIFKILMATRATGLSQDHVQALNLIDLEFQGTRFKKIREVWRAYLDHLGSLPQGEDVQSRFPVWSEKKVDLLADLLIEMGKPLGYEFDAVHVKKGIYLPVGHTQLENEQALIRQGAIRLLFGDAGLKVDVKNFPVDQETSQQQKRLMEQWLKVLDNSVGTPVSVREGTKE
ncbi:MAG: DUF6680 family protein [Candidatus Competibacteraceae bacterium]